MTSARVQRLFSALAAFPEKEALVFGGRSWSFGELDAASRRYAAGLSALGIGMGDRVAVFAESSPETIIALLAHYRLGAIHVPINTRYRSEEAGHILRDSGARAVLVAAGSEQESVLRDVGAVEGLATRVVLGAVSGSPGEAGFSSLLESEPLGGDPAPADEDVAVIVYTSGTTGRSKGAALSYRALVENTAALTGEWRFSAEDRLALFLPLFHVHGLCIGIHGALLNGTTLLLSARFDAGELVRLFAERGATVFMGVPTMYVRLLEHLGLHPEAAADLARARLFTSGSAPLPAADFAAFEKATGHRILERYGMTETLFTLSNPYDGQRRPGTVGFPVGGCDVRIVDDGGSEVDVDVHEGETGEILVRGNGMMTAYWGRPEETRAAFRDGWFATGDVAARDGDGYVRILGRKSVDVIKSGGFKISAREIEEVIAGHPSVREVAVVGAPDRVWGERIVAAVVLRGPGEEGVEREVTDLCARSLADYKRPKEVCVLDALPRNALGKVQKHRILETLAARMKPKG